MGKLRGKERVNESTRKGKRNETKLKGWKNTKGEKRERERMEEDQQVNKHKVYEKRNTPSHTRRNTYTVIQD